MLRFQRLSDVRLIKEKNFLFKFGGLLSCEGKHFINLGCKIKFLIEEKM
jgi:hypothetical protein